MFLRTWPNKSEIEIDRDSREALFTPLFSVIIPFFDRAATLAKTLDSILQQSYRPIQVILVNDGSTDSSGTIARKWAKTTVQDDSLQVDYLEQDNQGAAAARNAGSRLVRGSYVQFLDSDDTLHPERLERLVECFGTSGAELIQTGFSRVDFDTGRIIETRLGRVDDTQRNLAFRGLLWANTLRTAFSAELVKRLGPWRTDMVCFEDREYVERAVMESSSSATLPEVLATAHRGRNDQKSNHVKSREGRVCRIACEESLAKRADLPDMSEVALSEFRSRIYALGFRCRARGWPDLAARCGVLADSVEADLDWRGRRRHWVFRRGATAARLYRLAGSLKRF